MIQGERLNGQMLSGTFKWTNGDNLSLREHFVHMKSTNQQTSKLCLPFPASSKKSHMSLITFKSNTKKGKQNKAAKKKKHNHNFIILQLGGKIMCLPMLATRN